MSWYRERSAPPPNIAATMKCSANIAVAVRVISVDTALSCPTRNTAITAKRASLFGRNGNRPTKSRIIDKTIQKPKCGPGRIIYHNKAHNSVPADNLIIWTPKIHQSSGRSSVNTRREKNRTMNDRIKKMAAERTEASVYASRCSCETKG